MDAMLFAGFHLSTNRQTRSSAMNATVETQTGKNQGGTPTSKGDDEMSKTSLSPTNDMVKPAKRTRKTTRIEGSDDERRASEEMQTDAENPDNTQKICNAPSPEATVEVRTEENGEIQTSKGNVRSGRRVTLNRKKQTPKTTIKRKVTNATAFIPINVHYPCTLLGETMKMAENGELKPGIACRWHDTVVFAENVDTAGN